MNLRDRTLAVLQSGLRHDGYYTETSSWYEAGGVEHVDIDVGVDGQCIGQFKLTVKNNGSLVEKAATTRELEVKGRSIFADVRAPKCSVAAKVLEKRGSGSCGVCGAGPDEDCLAGLHG